MFKTDTVATDSQKVVEEEPAKEDTSEVDIALIQAIYSKCVFGDDMNNSFLKKNCTKEVLSRLAAAYEYDGSGYAVWEFRSDYTDRDGPSKVNSITPEADGWYKVPFIDMGHKGTIRIRVTEGKISDYRK